MKYLPPFEALKTFVNFSAGDGETVVRCRFEELLRLIRLLIIDVPVDEVWYRERYPDVAEAISQGIVTSAKSHFVNHGYFEGRQPFPIRVDEQYYLAENPGVAEYVRKGLLGSGQQHFDENGYQEGRQPFGLQPLPRAKDTRPARSRKRTSRAWTSSSQSHVPLAASPAES